MARKRRRNAGQDDGPQIRVKALKLRGRKTYVLRWTDPATGRQREEATEIAPVDRNRRKAMRAAADKEGELLERLEAGLPVDPVRAPRGVTVRVLVDRHLEWVEANRSDSLLRQRRSLLEGFAAHVVTGELPGAGEPLENILAPVVDRAHAEQFIASRKVGAVTLRAIAVAIKAAWNWAADHGSLPKHHRPMATLPRGRIPMRDLSEADLPTADELAAIFRWAAVATSKVRAGTGRWRKRQPDEYFEAPECRTFGEMIRVYHATGARTGELCALLVRDYMPSTKQLVLGKHKRSSTQRKAGVRNIQLGADALAAVQRNIKGKAPGAPLFARADGKPWTQDDVNRRFRSIRTIAGEHEQPIREHVTPYSFRHLYISELLSLGTPIFQVAKMAGTSPGEIERTYGHFFNRDLADVQRKLDRSRARLGEFKGEKRASHGKS